MKRITSIVLTIVLICSHNSVFSQFANLEFIENKGQWNDQIKFKGVLNNGAFFLQEKGFRVLLNKPEDVKKLGEYYHGISDEDSTGTLAGRKVQPTRDRGVTVHSHAYDVQFVNAGNPSITPDKPLNTYNNYFIGNDPKKWGRECAIFQAVTYRNMYPGIDVRYYTNEGQLKYDIIVHPGADLTPLTLRFDGVDGLDIQNEQLVVKTSVGEVRELAPYAYQVINGVKKEVPCRFKLSGKGRLVQFDVSSYAASSVLVIDPTLVFSTFSGSTAENWGYTATYGPDGSFYAGGIVFNQGFPVSPGAFMTTYNTGNGDSEGIGSYDIGIMKFNPTGTTRVYGTYLGGSGNEQPHSLVVDPSGNLIIAGRSNSPNYPVRSGAGSADFDIIVTKLNATGTDLIGSRKIGGKKMDGVNIRPKYPINNTPTNLGIRRNYGDDARSEVILDNQGNVWVASNTQSDDFPTTAGAFQKTLAGNQDAVILKLSSDLSNILASTLLGGSENDAAFVLAVNPTTNNIYVGGNTGSSDLPGNKSGSLYSTFQGGETDGFVAIISDDGNTLIKTSYMGTSGNDMLYGIQFDKFSFPYIMGTTTGTQGWPVVNAAFSQTGGKQFISKLKPDLSAFEYSTVFGTNTASPNISPIAFLVDRCENVYVSGWGGSSNTKASYPSAGTSGLTVTRDAIKSSTDNSDFYFFVLERNATRQLYGSFFGQTGGFGEHVDGGTSRFDRNGVIYQALCANCGRDVPFPTTPGVWSPNNGASECNLAAVKIAFNLAGVTGSVRASINGVKRDTTGCVPLTVDFTDTIGLGQRYVWNFGDGSAKVETTTPSISHTFTAIGNYRVMLVSIDSSKCNVADTAYTNIRVRDFKGVLSFTSKKENPCDRFNYKFKNTSFVTPAAISFSNTSFRWDFGDNSPQVIGGKDSITHSFPGPGVYKVKLVLTDTNFCNAPDSIEVTLRIATNVIAEFETPAKGCAPYTASFNNTSAGGQQFFWDFGDGGESTEVHPVHEYSIPGTYVVNLRAVDSGTCNVVDSFRYTIVVSSKPVADYTFTPNPPKVNTAVVFANSSIGATSYEWNFGDGEMLKTTSRADVSHIYNESKTYNACLIAKNDFGCPDTVCHEIVAKILPLLDVPNAFTPNGDGINDKVYVRGFGIIKMTWRIYNRWGSLVFETSNRNDAWDGTYKGSLQPKEVYHYVLDVEYSDNTRFQKRGDITLLR